MTGMLGGWAGEGRGPLEGEEGGGCPSPHVIILTLQISLCQEPS